jgi:uncharacterized protein YwqG
VIEEPHSLLGRIALGIGVTILSWTIILTVIWCLIRLWYLVSGRKKRDIDNAEGRRLLGLMKRLAKPTMLLAPTKDEVFTKLGGDPELPPGLDWPQGDKQPRAFLAQVDLGELRAAEGPEWLPDAGRLYAFLDDDRFGFADTVGILFSDVAPGPARAAPADLPGKMIFSERRCGFLKLTSMPSLDWLDVDLAELNIDDEMLDRLADFPDEAFGDELQHRIGGYPSEIQGSQMAIECELAARGLKADAEVTDTIRRASKQWRLLLQIDTDPALRMNWGDGGRLYVFIRQKHAEAGDFSRTVTISQTC